MILDNVVFLGCSAEGRYQNGWCLYSLWIKGPTGKCFLMVSLSYVLTEWAWMVGWLYLCKKLKFVLGTRTILLLESSHVHMYHFLQRFFTMQQKGIFISADWIFACVGLLSPWFLFENLLLFSSLLSFRQYKPKKEYYIYNKINNMYSCVRSSNPQTLSKPSI